MVIRLAAVLYSRSRPISGKGNASRQGEPNEQSATESLPSQRSFDWEGRAKGKGGAARKQAAERTASYLADKLGDSKSLAFFRRAADVLPPEVIRDALVRALDLRSSDVRRSRAAYFTSIIMPHLRRCEPKA
jgi:hypothetical protein